MLLGDAGLGTDVETDVRTESAQRWPSASVTWKSALHWDEPREWAALRSVIH